MKKIFFSAVLCTGTLFLSAQKEPKFNDTAFLKPVEVLAIRAADNAPFAKTNLNSKDIEKNNLGQDLPFVLDQTPSVVVNSDAGNGVGYTGIHIRGIDATRINVTLNGIPYNDAESQGTFFVDIPDMLSSTGSIQVQRGIGTSTNGSGAFGSSVNLATNEVNSKCTVALNNSFGSFNTWKNNLQFGSGILWRHFTIDGRLSSIRSDGYIDRAKSNLMSAYGSAAYVSEKNSLRLNIFSGKEKTYQAWNGVPDSLLQTDRTYNSNGTEKPGTPYDNETDNYIQTHYQLFYNQKLNKHWKANVAVFFTKGRGYYEEYKAGQSLSDYGLPDYTSGTSIITQTDLVRRLWLDNNFYGTIFSLQCQDAGNGFIAGGGWNGYDGKHYGEVIWSAVPGAIPPHYHWYDLTANKKDLSLFGKWTRQWNTRWLSFADLQYRDVPYALNGFEANPTLLIRRNYSFINPKLGITFTHKCWKAYASWAMAGKEPIRDDFEAGTTQQPSPETLYDTELGIETSTKKYSFGAGLYYMKYHNQLVLTGKINDVGAYTRTNIPVSYRAGIELQGKVTLSKLIGITANLTLSENKIRNFTEYLDDYDNGGQVSKFYPKTEISFSPSAVASGTITLKPADQFAIELVSKYVGRQYLDNTSHLSRSLDPYFLQNLRLAFSPGRKFVLPAELILQLNNVFNKKYEPNGYSYSYVTGGNITTENFYFPMAGFNFMLGVNVRW